MLLGHVLGKKLQISPIYQLTFVLETLWQLVQSKLILWVVFSVQTSLDHFGADSSFKFVWLHTPKAIEHLNALLIRRKYCMETRVHQQTNRIPAKPHLAKVAWTMTRLPPSVAPGPQQHTTNQKK
ncbi:hypothetical protein Gpo141_00013044 [Globisporangium polare]